MEASSPSFTAQSNVQTVAAGASVPHVAPASEGWVEPMYAFRLAWTLLICHREGVFVNFIGKLSAAEEEDLKRQKR